MAKKAYVGVNGQPHNGTALYVGVNNVPRKVVKGYVGVNGVPCVFWDKTAPPVIIPSWDFWTCKVNPVNIYKFLQTINEDRWVNPPVQQKLEYAKNVTSIITFYGVVKRQYSSQLIEYCPIFVSPQYDNGVKIDVYKNDAYITQRTYDYRTTYESKYWFFSYDSRSVYESWEASISPDCFVSDTIYDYSYDTDAFQDLMARLKSTPFQDAYQTGRTYTLYTDDIRKMIRKAISTWLYTNSKYYTLNPWKAYKAISDNCEDLIIPYILSQIASNCGSSIVPLVQIMIGGITEVAIYVQFGTAYSIGTTDQVTGCALTYTETNRGYTRYYFETHDYPEGYFVYETGAYPDWLTLIEADSSGNLTYSTMDAWETQADMIKFAAGLVLTYNSGAYDIEMTNLGINL